MAVRYWEDFKPGEVIELGSRTIDRDGILAFAREFDPQPFHTDEEAAIRRWRSHKVPVKCEFRT